MYIYAAYIFCYNYFYSQKYRYPYPLESVSLMIIQQSKITVIHTLLDGHVIVNVLNYCMHWEQIYQEL